MNVTRRKFLGLVGAGTAATFLPGRAWSEFELAPDEWERWKRSLFEKRPPRVYRSDTHTDARMHLGGIGTGNFEIGADGQLTTWQLWHNLRDGMTPFYFAIKAGDSAKLLQTAGGPDWPRVKSIEMTGEYPVATLRFADADLPVTAELTAFTPFAPLDVELSSLPAAIFNFRLRNPAGRQQEVSLAAMAVNPVGYSSIGRIKDGRHPALGANMNQAFAEGPAAGFFLTAQRGDEPTLDRPVTICVLRNVFVAPPDPGVGNKNYASVSPRDLAVPPLDRPEVLKVEVVDAHYFPMPSPQTVIWLEDAPREISEEFLRRARDAVRNGATLVFSGRSLPLIDAYAGAGSDGAPRPDIVFENFENGYSKWKVEGAAFGDAPARGTLPNQQPVGGFAGHGLVNSYLGGDGPTGKMTSEPFIIDRHFVHFLVGGGHWPGTQIRLVVDGKVERAKSGRDNERLEPAVWNVRDLAGRTGHIEIVDSETGGWGHINIDEIIFSDAFGEPGLMSLLDELLPIRCRLLRRSGTAIEFDGLRLCPGTTRSETPLLGLQQFTRALGKGKVVLIAGQLLAAEETDSTRARQTAYSILCGLAGATYTMTEGQSAKAPGFGSMALAVLAGNVAGLAGFDDWNAVWEQFHRHGFPPLAAQSSGPTPPGQTIHCALTATVSVPPHGEIEVPFLLTWHFPNHYNAAGEWMGCHYATQWEDARAVMKAVAAKHDSWRADTELFQKTFYDSTLPWWLLDAVTANAAIARHNGVVFRIANGDIYGWEGSNGSCQPTCTHVWGYEQAVARLFPALEREMRRIDFTHQQRDDGGINNRTDVPSPLHPTGERPFTDGHASCILKAWREAQNSTDETFLREYWPRVKRAMEYLIERDRQSAGGAPAGLLQDDQWNTYDQALHGVTTFLGGYYLAALRVGEEWARRMGDEVTAGRFRGIFGRGQARLVELCWNGEYFQQHLPDYLQRNGEVGPGCMSDQLIGQWWAHQLGLGYILPEQMVKSALRSIFRHNFKSDLTGWKHAPRAFAGEKDKGLIICTWPKGGRPRSVMLYSDEVWTGIEYQVAAHMIYEGLVDEGFAIARGARDRYDGVPRKPIARNPWCEIECGGHYSRAMSSWSLLLAVSGYHYDPATRRLHFVPAYEPGRFKCFFSAPAAWGSLAQQSSSEKQTAVVAVKKGTLPVASVQLKTPENSRFTAATVRLGETAAPARLQLDGRAAVIQFDPLTLRKGDELTINLS